MLAAAGVVDAATAVLIDGQRRDAEVAKFAYSSEAPDRSAILFAGERSALRAQLVRWGQPSQAGRALWLRLRDGSVLAAGSGWAAEPRVRFEGQTISVRRGSEWIELTRDAVGCLIVDGEPDLASLDTLPSDRITLRGDDQWQEGDRIEGELLAIKDGSASVAILGNATPIALDRVARIDLAAEQPVDRSQRGCLVGLTDGSLLHAEWVRIVDGDATVRIDGVELRLASSEVVFLQPRAGPVRYLSDAPPRDYRQTPYFDLEWPLGVDQTPLGRCLSANGMRYAKGIATHAAARVIYELESDDSRFQAELAIADNAADATPGSVVFRVYTVSDGKLSAIYESPVIRGGDEPTPIDLDVAGAAALVLVVDFADNGDAGDDALWLDARIVMSSG